MALVASDGAGSYLEVASRTSGKRLYGPGTAADRVLFSLELVGMKHPKEVKSYNPYYEDSRGYFARTWCAREFADHGLPDQLVQASLSYNRRRGTVRGMHLQRPPSREAKLVSCVQGAIVDVIVDLRPGSPTFLRHVAVELSAASRDALFIPPMMAHGFQTLADDTCVQYQMTDYYAPELGCGWRWDDPAFPANFPWFNSQRYWQDQILALREQQAALQEAPLRI